MESRASAKYLRGSAQKARLVIDMIRGKNVNQALAILRYSNKRAAAGIEKCVKSAIANANESAEKANVAVDPDELWLRAAYVDQGPTKNRRRVRPAPQGRAYRERRHFCHVTITLSTEKPGDGSRTVQEGAPAVSARARRGGAAAAPRAKRRAAKEAAESAAPAVEPSSEQASETMAKAAKKSSKKAPAKSEAKKEDKKKETKSGTKTSGRKKSEK